MERAHRESPLPVRPLVDLPSMVPSASLPALHKPHGNLSRKGAGDSRLDHLQRQFEHAGRTPVPLSLSERAAALQFAHRRRKLAGLDPAARRRAAAREGLELEPDDERLTERLGASRSVTNLVEVRLAELVARRPRDDSMLDAAALEAASRGVVEESLAALHELGDVVAPNLAPTLRRIAEALEPCVLSDAERDDLGRRRTYEQVCRVVLQPRLREARQRMENAELEADAARHRLQVVERELAATRAELASQKPALLSLESKRSTLELQLSGARREAAELVEANHELQQVHDGVITGMVMDPRTAALSREAAALRETNEKLRQQVASLVKTLAEGATREDYEAALAQLAAGERQRDEQGKVEGQGRAGVAPG